MRNLILLLVLFVASFSYATSIEKNVDNNQFKNQTRRIICIDKNMLNKNKPIKCSTSITTSTATNADGSSTQTTTTTVSCDTPQELAQFHALMVAIGMGV